MTSTARREARARLLAALLWTAVAAAAVVGLVATTGESPMGRAFGVAAGGLAVAVLAGLVVAAVNGSLVRRPGRTDLGGPTSLALLAAVVCPLLTLAVGLLVGRPYELGQLALVLVGAGLYAGLGLIAVATWQAARRPRLATATATRPAVRRTSA